MKRRVPGGVRVTLRREKCQVFGTRPDGTLGLRGRALKVEMRVLGSIGY